MSKNTKKPVLLLVSVVIIVLGYFAFQYYHNNLAGNIKERGKLYIPTNASYQQVLDSISPFLKDKNSFEVVAKKMNYPQQIKAGRYSLKKGLNNKDLLQMLRLGNQDEIAIRIGNYNSIYQLASRISPLLEADSAQIIAAIVNGEYSKGFDTSGMLYYFIPNTYNFHWNTSGKQFVEKMSQEYDKFWNPERVAQAQKLDMNKFEIITLASIVQLESSKPDEQPNVAGLYLNRLKIGMKLDADPTVIFAMKKENGNQKIERVYYKNLKILSLYNTYMYAGLPPGPICMPNPSAIDAVLNPTHHDYLYFVADPSKPGYHIYAKTLSEQEANAQKYRNWLNDNAIH